MANANSTIGTHGNLNYVIPELFAEAIKQGFAGMKCLNGSPAAIIDRSLNSRLQGETVSVPYFGAIGSFTALNDGAEISPTAFSSSKEQAAVQRYGLGFDMTRWAQMAGVGEPYKKAAEMVVEAMAHKIDDVLISTAVTNLNAAYKHDISAVTGADTLSWAALCSARALFGDEQTSDMTIFLHSDKYFDLLKLVGSDGHPLFTTAQEGGIGKIAGMNVVVSDKCPKDTTGADPVYTTLICKKGALCAWLNADVGVKVKERPETDSTAVYLNFYMAAHRYNYMPGYNKGGVVALISK